jgi:hypothetical protein
MSGAIVTPRLSRIKRQRTHKIFIDSRDLVPHENNNPSNYTYFLNETIANVIKVRLLSFRVPYSPTFVVIRSSKWFAAGTEPEDLTPDDYVHIKALELQSLISAADVEKSSVVATIYKQDGTVSLNIVEVFSINRVRDINATTAPGTDFRSYDIFVCTGALYTSNRDGWYLQHPQSQDPILGDLEMVTEYSDASIAVNVLDENMYLTLRMGQGKSRLNSVRTVYPPWKSFQVYRRGDISFRDNIRYTCLRNHMSLIFAEDVLTYWHAIDVNKFDSGPADNTFYVLEATDANESVLLATAGYDEITQDMARTNVSSILIEWKTRRGSHFIFPHGTSIDFLSFTDETTPAVIKKEYRYHTLLLELVYEEETEALISGNADPNNLTVTPNFLLPNTSTFESSSYKRDRMLR